MAGWFPHSSTPPSSLPGNHLQGQSFPSKPIFKHLLVLIAQAFRTEQHILACSFKTEVKKKKNAMKQHCAEGNKDTHQDNSLENLVLPGCVFLA